MTLDELLVLAGGPVHEDALPPPVTVDEYHHFSGWLGYAQQLAGPLAQGAGSARVVIAQSRSPSLVCRVRPLDDGSAAVVVPLGVLARTRVFARILLHALHESEHEPSVQVVASILDDTSESDWAIAPLLTPLLGEIPDEAAHWSRLADLNTQISREGVHEGAVDDLIWVCSSYLVWHEVAHVLRGHFDDLDEGRSVGLDEVSLRRALELDADANAATLLLFSLLSTLEERDALDAAGSMFFWLGYGLAMLFALYDSRRKALSLYSEAFYPHPVVRLRLFSEFARGHLAEHHPDLLEQWDTHQLEGWNECVRSVRRLDVQAMLGRFGGSDEDVHRFIPVTALNYAQFDSTFVVDDAERQKAQAREVLARLA